MAHSLFSPSAAHRWIPCPGSMAFPENTGDGESSTFADDGTATHHWAAMALNGIKPHIGEKLTFNGKEYVLDEERAERIAAYVEDVQRRAIGGSLFVEQWVDISDVLGEGQGGTTDAAIYLPPKRVGVVEDLKDGGGETIYASYVVEPATDTTPEVREPNPQLALYAFGLLDWFEMLGGVDHIDLVICQPKKNHIDEFRISVADLREFAGKATRAVQMAGAAMVAGPLSLTTAGYFNPGEKQCKWCRAKANCPALTAKVSAEVRMEFDDCTVAVPPPDFKQLAKHFAAIPLIEQWCEAVKAELANQVAGGAQVIGPDGKPFKFVEGKAGARAWADPKAAEAALVGVLGPKAYAPPKILTAPAAGKLLDKAKTAATWKDVFEPLIKRGQGRPVLALGSDPRPPCAVAATADEFEDDEDLTA